MATKDEEMADLVRQSQPILTRKKIGGFELFDPQLQSAEKMSESALDSKRALDIFDALFEAGDVLIPAQDNPQQAEIKGIKRTFGRTRLSRLLGFSESDESSNALTFSDVREAFGTLIARGLGERGVVTNRDVARVVKLLPKENDTFKERRNRRAIVNSVLKKNIDRYNKIVEALRKRRLS